MDWSMPGFPVFHYLLDLLKLMSIELIMPFHHLTRGNLLLLLPSIFPSIGAFFNELALTSDGQSIALSALVLPMNIGLISFKIDWLDLLSVQETLKSLLQHHSSKVPILWCSAFFIVQLSHSYMTTGKIIALTIWTFVSKMISLLFNMLYRFVIAFLPRRKRLLISWLQLLSHMILEPKKIKSVTVFIFLIYLLWI